MGLYYKGVNIQEGEAPSPISGISTVVQGLLGTFQRGPTDQAVVCNNMAEFERIFGTKALVGTTSYYSVKQAFTECSEFPFAIINVKGPSAAASDKTFQDQDDTPEDTLTIAAAWKAADGDNIAVEISNQSRLTTTITAGIDAGAETANLQSTTTLEVGSYLRFEEGVNDETVTLTAVNHTTGDVYWSGGLTNAYTTAATLSTREFKISIYYNNVAVTESPWEGLTMNDDHSRFCEKVINGNSNWIEVTDLDSASVGYKALPAATSGKEALTGGDDDLDGLELTHWQGSAAAGSGMYGWLGIDNLVRICCPNPKINTDADTSYIQLVKDLEAFARNELIHCQVYAEVPYNDSPDDAETFAGNFEGRRLSLFYPWLKAIEDGAVVWVPPTAGILGVAAYKDRYEDIIRSIGNHTLSYGTDLERMLSKSEDDALNEIGVNTILIDNGLRVWGDRTQSADNQFRFGVHSEYYNYTALVLLRELRAVAFKPNTPTTRAQLARRLGDYAKGELERDRISAYEVICDDSNNPAEDVAAGIMRAHYTYQPAGVAEKIVIVLTSDPSGVTIQ